MVFFVGFNLPGGLLAKIPGAIAKTCTSSQIVERRVELGQLGLLALRMVGRKEDHRVLKGLDDERC